MENKQAYSHGYGRARFVKDTSLWRAGCSLSRPLDCARNNLARAMKDLVGGRVVGLFSVESGREKAGRPSPSRCALPLHQRAEIRLYSAMHPRRAGS